MMKKILVENIDWSGGPIKSYTIVTEGRISDESIVVAPSLHLLEKSKEGVSLPTLRSMASDLCAYFQTLSDYSIDWRQVTDDQMSGYLYKILFIRKKLCRLSIERAISSIRGFYFTAEQIGILDRQVNLSYDYSEAAELRRQKSSFSKPDFDLFKQYVHKDIFSELLGSITTKSPFLRERDELTLKLGFHCGLRASEVTSPLNLNTATIKAALIDSDARGELAITLPIIGKGNKIRYVDFDPSITRAIRSFIEGRRSALPDGQLICATDGRTISESHATRVFKSAKVAGLLKIKKLIRQYKNNKNNKEYDYMITFASASKLVFHSLRHTFATNSVRQCYRLNLDPWVYVRDQMGHERRETTEAYITFEANIHARDLLRSELSIQDENY